MNKKILVISILTIIVVYFVIARGSVSLVSPVSKQNKAQSSSQPSAQSVTPSYNAPKEIKYDSSTDLKRELDSINPQVLDSDFQI